MKTFDECSQWIRDFIAWQEAAPEGCEENRPKGMFWELENCSEHALNSLRTFWGGKLSKTAAGRVLMLDFNIAEHAFRFSGRLEKSK